MRPTVRCCATAAAALHHQVALGLERDEGGLAAVEPELLAYHFAEAGIAHRAIDYHLKAAERAMARCALAEMVSHLRRGIGLLNGLPDMRETRRQELALQVALGRGLIDQVGSASDQGHAAFVRARELCLELGDTDLLLSVLYGLQVYHFSHAEPAGCDRLRARNSGPWPSHRPTRGDPRRRAGRRQRLSAARSAG